jgi:hypothetical protein
MGRFGAGVSRGGVNTADSAYFLLLGGTGHRLEIVEIKVSISVAPTTAPLFYLARTTARGTQTSTLAGQPLDPADTQTPIGTLDVVGTAPTFTAANKIDIGGLAVTAGGIWVWTFYDRPLLVPATANAGLAVVNANASGATTGTFASSYRWDE